MKLFITSSGYYISGKQKIINFLVHLIILFFLMLIPIMSNAISPLQVVPGSGIKDIEDSKIYQFRYHNLADDYHLSGPTIWAVRFNFKAAYPLADSATFSLNSFKIYNPYQNMEMRVSLWNEQYAENNDLIYFPGSIIPGGDWQNITLFTNPTNIVFPEIQNPLQVVWLVMELTTPITGKYISASEGSGKNSFYYNTTVHGNEYWQSLFSAGFACEIRISAVGDFNLLNTDLELLNFTLPENILPSSTVYPSVTVYNHSNFPITDTLSVHFSDPMLQLDQYLLIPLQNINTRDSLRVVSSEGITFNREPTEVKVNLAFKNHPSVVLPARYYNVFMETGSCHLIEYFRRYTFETDDIPRDDSGLHHLLYIPNQADYLSCLGASQRFNFYQMNSLPQTVVDGYKRFHLPLAADSEQILTAISSAQEKRSFISSSETRINILDPDNPENLLLNITLSNDSTTLFEWSSTSAIYPKFFAAIFEENNFENRSLYTLKKWLVYNEPISSTINLHSSMEIDLIINTSELDSLKSYRVYYWLQNSYTNGGQVFYAKCATLPYGWTVANSDDNLPRPNLKIYPNPLNNGQSLKISGFTSPSVFTVYNLKGQKIFTTGLINAEVNVPFEVFPASGIYFVQSETSERGKAIKQIKKISIIK